ncbi:uncharacterized protein [Miscanthus floridulus]|uniref:uncharacterized protein n=1 Tax=Miscanthus floridulus TaxID=154761 RepID=UPI00345B1EFA
MACAMIAIYVELSTSYNNGRYTDIDTFVQANSAVFQSDNNLGLVKQVLSDSRCGQQIGIVTSQAEGNGGTKYHIGTKYKSASGKWLQVSHGETVEHDAINLIHFIRPYTVFAHDVPVSYLNFIPLI